MSTYKTIFILSFLIFVIPFLGFPEEFDLFINSALALFLMFTAVVIRLKKQSSSSLELDGQDEHRNSVFEENIPEESDISGTVDTADVSEVSDISENYDNLDQNGEEE